MHPGREGGDKVKAGKIIDGFLPPPARIEILNAGADAGRGGNGMGLVCRHAVAGQKSEWERSQTNPRHLKLLESVRCQRNLENEPTEHIPYRIKGLQ